MNTEVILLINHRVLIDATQVDQGVCLKSRKVTKVFFGVSESLLRQEIIPTNPVALGLLLNDESFWIAQYMQLVVMDKQIHGHVAFWEVFIGFQYLLQAVPFDFEYALPGDAKESVFNGPETTDFQQLWVVEMLNEIAFA